jgi:hypothetical protein
MGRNWTAGLAFVTRPWVIIHHDDDYLEASSFEDIKEYLNSDVGFISFDHFLVGRNNQIRRANRSDGLTGILENTPKFISTIFNVEKVKSLNAWEDRFGYFLDLVLLIKLQQKYSSIHVPIAAGYYRLHADNASNKDKRTSGYLAYVPVVIAELFPLISDPNLRKNLLFHLASYSCPHINLGQKLVSKFAKLIGLKAWVIS